jgi:hypothetical protein
LVQGIPGRKGILFYFLFQRGEGIWNSSSQGVKPCLIVFCINHITALDLSKKHIRFGCFAQVYDSTNNITKGKTIDAISLYPANAINGYYFMSLATGNKSIQKKWTE